MYNILSFTKYFCAFGVLLAQIAFASDHVEALMNALDSSQHFVYPQTIQPCFEDEIRQAQMISHSQKKALYKIMRLTFDSSLPTDSLDSALKLTNCIRAKIDTPLAQPIVIFGKENFDFDWDIIFTSQDKIYFLPSKAFDAKSIQGGFKTFRRAIALHLEKPVAALESIIDSEKSRKYLYRELYALKHLSAKPHIVEIYDSVIVSPQKKDENNKRVVIFANLYQGDLLSFRKKIKTKNWLMHIFPQALLSINEVHKESFIHRDLKPANFLIKRLKRHSYYLALTDFGLALSTLDKMFGKNVAGTKGYIAPDWCLNFFAKGIASENFVQAIKNDYFGLGMTFLNMILGQNHIYFKKIRELNELVLNRNVEPKLDKRSFYNAYDSVYESYHLLLKEPLPKIFKSKAEKKYWQLLLRLVHPESSKRPDLMEIQTIISDL